MSPHDSIAALLSEMGFAELTLTFIVVGAYSLAINGSLSSALRSAAASIAFVASVAFAALTPSWMAAIAFLAVAVLAVAAFAGAVWVLSSALGFGTESGFAAGSLAAETDERATSPAPLARPARALAAAAVRSN